LKKEERVEREFFSMDELGQDGIRELQLKCLDILVYFRHFCDQNKLTFYLAGGTAIGALRHQGFIPWDDDIDVFMPRPDYEKLTRLWNDVADTSKYIFIRSTEETNYHHHAASIVDVNTTWIEERNRDNDIPQGIMMDIIPLDGCPDSGFKRAVQLYHALKFAVFNAQRLPENKSKVVYYGSKFVLGIVRGKRIRDAIWMSAEKKMTRYGFYSNKDITELIGSLHGMKTKHPLENFITTVDVDFEGYKMPLMKGYESYLTSIFGNYMQLPSKEDRVPKRRLVYANLDEPYTKFKGIYYLKNKEED
jgi:lipopolysaccharide cholinephosphotransferase